jgi:hypothetical protein
MLLRRQELCLPAKERRLPNNTKCITDENERGHDPNSKRTLEKDLEILNIEMVEPLR